MNLAPQEQTSLQITPNRNFGYLFVKRTVDIIASLLGLIILSPVFLVTAIAIKVEDPKGKVFYNAPRGGQYGRPFLCYKFRSMYANADAVKDFLAEQNEMQGPVFKIKNDPRITKVGKIIRKTSIDELPQFLNVLQGHISLVGPRPLPIKEALAVPAQYKAREEVQPGITCIWQISGRNEIDFDDWMKLDLEYVRKQSLLFDTEILLKTIPAVFTNRGAS
jgi:Sugar transferases involved in lipopolysaccharide synthesis